MRQCKLKTEKELKKEGRCSFDGAIDLNSGVSIVRWYDNKQVQLASNFSYIDPVGTVTRWSKKDNKIIEISRPGIVNAYNKSMGGVDLFDMFRSLYHMDHESQRWYIRIFFWILSSSIINGWVLHKKHCNVLGITEKNQLTLIQFTAEVSDGLIKNAVLQPRRSVGRPRLNTSVISELDTSLSPSDAGGLLICKRWPKAFVMINLSIGQYTVKTDRDASCVRNNAELGAPNVRKYFV